MENFIQMVNSVVWVFLCSFVFYTTSTTLDLNLFDLSVHPNALCNDGTPSGFYFKPGSPSSNLWIVFQQGGEWCYDEPTCRARPSQLSSSKDWSKSKSLEGLFDSTDPRLKGANLIYVPYCSSDAYIGNLSAERCPFGFNFMGRAIVEAVWKEAVRRGLGAREGTEVLYGGCSAGARGAMFNLDFVAQWLHANVGEKVSRFGGLLDSCFWIDIDPLVTKSSLSKITQRVYSNYRG